jgi:nucleoside-diphosphate-sugar epimerase
VLPVVPHLNRVRFQAVHAHDIADAYRRALLSDASGAYNIAADPVMTTKDVAGLLRARSVPVPMAVARAALDLTWRMRLHPLSPGWLDMAAQIPALDATRARTELGWTPAYDGREALRTVLRGIAGGASGPTPALEDQSVTQLLRGAVRSGVGQRASADPRAQVDSG